MKPLICPNCNAEVYPEMYGDSSFTCFNCETVVFQISLPRTIKTNDYGEEGNTGIRDMEEEIPTEESSDESEQA